MFLKKIPGLLARVLPLMFAKVIRKAVGFVYCSIRGASQGTAPAALEYNDTLPIVRLAWRAAHPRVLPTCTGHNQGDGGGEDRWLVSPEAKSVLCGKYFQF